MAAYEWPLDKLTVINSALAQCGDNIINVQDDGSDEWLVCSAGYERGLGYLMEQGTWGWATKVTTLTPGSTAPDNTQWDTAYPLPPDLTHLIWVRINQTEDVTQLTNTPSPVLYDLENVGGVACLVTNSQGGPPPPDPAVTPSPITVKYVSQQFSDPTASTPTFVVALQTFVMSAIYRGLHEDVAEAEKMLALASQVTQQARSRYDLQKPKRALFNSRITASRRIRRPWPPVGSDSWGGTGVPG